MAAAAYLTEERGPVADEDFEAFYRRFFSRAVALAHALGGRAAAEDIAQDAFFAASRQWDRLDAPERWLLRVVANRSRSLLRRAYSEAGALRRLVGDGRSAVDPPQETDEFWAVVRSLPRRQAQVVALVYLEGLEASEVAEILGCAEATVRVHLHRARQHLAARFKSEV